MKSLWPLTILLLGGCATNYPPKNGETLSRIQAEMAAAQSVQALKAQEAIEQAMVPDVMQHFDAKKEKKEARFDLAVNEAPASQVLTAIVSGTPYSMLVPPDLTGRITVNLKNVTVREALEAIRELYGYDFKVQGTRIIVQPNTMQTRVFQVNYLASKRQGTSELAISSGSLSSAAPASGTTTTSSTAASSSSGGSQGAAASRVQTSSDVDFWSNLETALNALLAAGNSAGNTASTAEGKQAASETPGVILNKMSGVVLVRAMPKEMRLVENYLRVTQTVVERQVMLEAKIMEVQLSESHQSGVNWGAFRSGNNSAFGGGVVAPGASLSPLNSTGTAVTMTDSYGNSIKAGLAGTLSAVTGGAGLVGLAFQTANFSSLINFLESQGSVDVLSSPRIATLNNQKAVLKVGTDETFITGFTVSTTATSSVVSAVPTPITSTLFSGISLDVMPQIDADGQIVLHIHPAVSKITETIKSFNLGSTIPISLPLASRSVNESDSIVRVTNGNIVAIGGLMTQDQAVDRSGLPGTTQSAFGALVGQRANSLKKRELVILIKPTVIENASTWAKDLEDVSGRMQSYERLQGAAQNSQ
jgi:MSHA biogenesis protein MshL